MNKQDCHCLEDLVRHIEQQEQFIRLGQHNAEGLRSERDALKAEHEALKAEHDALKAEHDALKAERDALKVVRRPPCFYWKELSSTT